MAKKDKEKKEDAEEQEQKKGGGLKFIIIILLAFIIGAGGGFAAYMFLFKKNTPVPQTAPQNQTMSQQAAQAVAPPVTHRNEILPKFKLDPFIVNLADTDARRYLKVTITLEVSDDKVKDELKERTPEIRDIITLLLSSKKYTDISTFDGKLALKTEIMNRINVVLNRGKITNVYFIDFVVQ
jgi:flagellar FliL protein